MKSAVLAPRINMYMCDVFFEDDEYVRKCKCEVAEQIFLFRKFPISKDKIRFDYWLQVLLTSVMGNSSMK